MDLILKYLRLQFDRVFALGIVVAGGGTLLLGWVGVSRTGFPAEQIPYVVSGGLGGIFLLGLGLVVWLSIDLRDEWRKLDLIDEKLAALAIVDEDRTGSSGAVGDVFAADDVGPSEQFNEPKSTRRSRARSQS